MLLFFTLVARPLGPLLALATVGGVPAAAVPHVRRVLLGTAAAFDRPHHRGGHGSTGGQPADPGDHGLPAAANAWHRDPLPRLCEGDESEGPRGGSREVACDGDEDALKMH